MRIVNPRCGCPIPIGRLGENEATKVVFDVSEYAAFGSGTFSLLHQRTGDQAPYPCVIAQNGSTVEWEISSADCAVEGYGKCELIFTAGETIAKSKIFVTVTGSALTAGAEPPEPWEDWVQRVISAGAEVETFLQTLEGGTPDQVWTKTETGAEWRTPQGGGGGGTSDHRQLTNRNDADQHTIDSITGLRSELDAKASEEYVDGEVNDLQGQIDALAAASDVVDIVGTHAELLAYDTRDVHDNDIIKVIADETHAGAPSYYRWVISGGAGVWVYVGSESASYTKAEEDALLNQKQNKINEYIKSASVSGNTLNLTKQDDSTLSFTPQGGGGGDSWRLIRTITIPADASADTTPGVTWMTATGDPTKIIGYEFSTDEDGNPFSLEDIKIYGNVYWGVNAGYRYFYLDKDHPTVVGLNGYKGTTNVKVENSMFALNRTGNNFYPIFVWNQEYGSNPTFAALGAMNTRIITLQGKITMLKETTLAETNNYMNGRQLYIYGKE